VRQVRGHTVEEMEWLPSEFGLPCCRVEDLRVSDVKGSAAVILRLLAGADGPPRWIVLANAAAALFAAEKVATLPEGVARAAAAIDNGNAFATLEALRQLSR
jgi:anthranilate phosphoribosyltransferase